MTTDKKPTNFKPVAVHKDDWERYNQLANDLSTKLGTRISIAAAIKMAVSQYDYK
jgi:hypothetical protein